VYEWQQQLSEWLTIKKGLMVPGGQPFVFGYEFFQEQKEDAQAWGLQEGPDEICVCIPEPLGSGGLRSVCLWVSRIVVEIKLRLG